MDFRMLGKPELRVGDKRCNLGPRKERHVLAVMLLDLPNPVTAETLVNRVWGDDWSDGSYSSLYSVVSRLRKRLSLVSGVDAEKLLPKRSGSYALNVNRDDVDVWRFRRLRDEARQVAGRDDLLAVALYKQADALWRGTPLHGLDGGWAESVRASLNEERLAAAIHRIRAELRLHRHADLVGDIARLAHEYPGNETLLGLSLTALYGSGRQPEALVAFKEARTRWRTEFGMSLGSELQDLHRLMLNGDPILDATASPEQPSRRVTIGAGATPPATPPSTIPRDNPDFTGRTVELATLAGWMTSAQPRSTVPVIVISGLHGVGKTELAVHAAWAFGDQDSPRLFVDLHTPDGNPVDPGTALGTLLQGLGVSVGVIPASTEDRVALWRSLLADKRALVVLDNAADSAQVRPLLPGAAGCRVLITTRRKSIDLPGMRWLPLEPLPSAEAAELFTRTAGGGRHDDAADVAAVLRLCGYLPQEIHFAANDLRRHPAWTAGELAGRLRESQAEGREVGVGFELAYGHLAAAPQRLLRQLTLHPGPGFSQYAACALAQDPSLGETRRALEVLLDYHLIDETAPGRYVLRDVVWKYARRMAGERDTTADRDLAAGRLLDYYLYCADQADRVMYPFHRRLPVAVGNIPASTPPLRTRGDCRAQMEAERPSFLAMTRYAAAQGRREHAGLLAHLLARFLDTWGCWAEAAELHLLAVSAWRAMRNTSGEAKALTELSVVLGRMGRYEEALKHASDALALARTATDRAAEADALDRTGVILWWMAHYPAALARFDEALSIWRALGDEDGEADTLMYSGIVAWHLSSYRDALARMERALALYRRLGDMQGEVNALNNLGELQYEAGDHDLALDSYQHALEMYKDLGDRQGEAIAVNNIGNACRETGRNEDALACYRAALDIYRDIGDRRGEADALNNMGTAYLRTGRHRDALEHHEQALVIAHQLGERYLTTESLNGSGKARLAAGSYSLAAEDFRTAIEVSKQIGDRSQEAQALTGLGDALLPAEEAGERDTARACWSRALTIFEDIGKPIDAAAVRDRLLMHTE
jgi:tetratricopeptide (TPR) repeat protein/DNA-binding SARP family transcriptional activator